MQPKRRRTVIETTEEAIDLPKRVVVPPEVAAIVDTESPKRRRMVIETTEEAIDLPRRVVIPPEVAALLDAESGYEPPPEGADPVEFEAANLVALFGGHIDTLREVAQKLDDDPVDGLNTYFLRLFALCLLRQIDRYAAARKALYGVPEGVLVDEEDEEDEEAPDEDYHDDSEYDA